MEAAGGQLDAIIDPRCAGRSCSATKAHVRDIPVGLRLANECPMDVLAAGSVL